MVLAARREVGGVVSGTDCSPVIFDLLTAKDLLPLLGECCPPDTTRVVTFFGMIPNFEPPTVLPKLVSLLRKEDLLLISANLAPGAQYEAGVQRVLPLYDNPETRDWLMTVLLDLGVDRNDGTVAFRIEDCPAGTGLKRIAASFRFDTNCELRAANELFSFQAGDQVELFFSYRLTPERTRILVTAYGIEVLDEWITASQEEGVFLCRRC
jgi:hypothetical protein